MKTIIRLFRWLLVSAVMFVITGVEGKCALAFHGFPADTWYVSSKYTNPMTGRVSKNVLWKYMVIPSEDSTVNVIVSDNLEKVAESATLIFDGDRRLVRADKNQTIQAREVKQSVELSATQPAVLDEFLVPGNWLNGQAPDAGETEYFIEKRKINRNVTFARRLSLTTAAIDSATAVSAGMIDDSSKDLLDGSSLILVSCKELPEKGDEKLLFRQLWSPRLSFWFYEKTPTRESWFVRDE